MQDLNTPTEQSRIKLCLQAKFQTSNKKKDKGQLELTELGQHGGLCLWAVAHACVQACVQARTCLLMCTGIISPQGQ